VVLDVFCISLVRQELGNSQCATRPRYCNLKRKRRRKRSIPIGQCRQPPQIRHGVRSSIPLTLTKLSSWPDQVYAFGRVEATGRQARLQDSVMAYKVEREYRIRPGGVGRAGVEGVRVISTPFYITSYLTDI
jgi:hypothetical protein